VTLRARGGVTSVYCVGVAQHTRTRLVTVSGNSPGHNCSSQSIDTSVQFSSVQSRSVQFSPVQRDSTVLCKTNIVISWVRASVRHVLLPRSGANLAAPFGYTTPHNTALHRTTLYANTPRYTCNQASFPTDTGNIPTHHSPAAPGINTSKTKTNQKSPKPPATTVVRI
jgi:hypothetical protein